jgi:hypothetical protein
MVLMPIAVVLAFVSMHDLPVDPRNVVHAVPGDHHRRSGRRVPALLRAGEACSRRDWGRGCGENLRGVTDILL